jgi:MFS superfamily sulfate permease-like transporter
VSNFSSNFAEDTTWARWLPGLVTLRSYQPVWLTRDLVARIVLATMLAPVCIEHAVASGPSAVYGLYATVACLLAYAVFGPCRILVLGPDSSRATIIFGVVSPLSGGHPHRAIAVAGVMALVSGAILLIGGIARLGFCDRPSVKADPLRLHERNRAHRASSSSPL